MVTTTAKVTRNRHRALVPAICSAAAAMALLSSPSGAADWKITPTLELRETYSDNIGLFAAGNEKSDFVTQINPGISLKGNGPRLKVNARYGMQNLIYAEESSRNAVRHLLSADANAELLDDFLFLDGKASISQQNISAFNAQTADSINTTNNLTETRTYSISPYLRHRFGSTATSELRYTHDSVDSSTSGLLAREADHILLKIISGTAFNTLGWGLDYSKQRTDYTSAGAADLDMESLSGQLRYRILPRLSLIGTGGYEKFSYLSISDKPESAFWSAGFSWTPAERTSLMASAGKRFFGTTYALKANHRTRRTVWNVDYSEDITTTQSQFLVPATIDTANFLGQLLTTQYPDLTSEERQKVIDDFIRQTGLPSSLSESINYFTNRVLLQKRLQASVALNGAKNTLVLSVFNMLREAQTSQDIDSSLLGSSNLALYDNTRQVGASALWNWRLSAVTSANIGVGYTRISSIGTDRKDNTRTLKIGLARKFQPKLHGALDFRHNQRDSNLSGGDYSENAITASLLMSF